EPPLECTECGRGFGQKPDLVRHRLAHGGERGYACGRCGRGFGEAQSFLILHQRRHSSHHLILCPCCNRTFMWASDFVRHHQTHTGERPYQCGVCQKTFKRTYHLNVH
ncbi:ZN195 protein, partial [Halcyon senegalensis]|nr:ZN195 protein [Halcyon senegalensis]